MSTASTKSRAGKRLNQPATARANMKGRDEEAAYVSVASNQKLWLIGSAIILIIAAALRLYHLDLVPFHHDEGVNGFFLTRLYRENFYQYDPQNYHGPTLYYFALSSTFIFGLTNFAVRFVPAAFGTATIWLILLLRRQLGVVGALAAAAFVAVSPGAVYLSRYFIHESLFVFFMLWIVYAVVRYSEDASPLHLMNASLAAALLFATKETAIINAGVLAIAGVSTLVYARMRGTIESEAANVRDARWKGYGQVEESLSEKLERFGEPSHLALYALAAVALFLAVCVLFYSSFFSNYPKGIWDAIEAFKFWSKTGKTEHAHAWYQYIQWLWSEEAVLLITGAVGTLIAFIAAKNRFAIFAGLWAVGIISAYSLITYKTPWLSLNFIIPLAVIGGYGIDAIYDWARAATERIVLIVVTVWMLGFSVRQMVDLNFVHYDDDTYPYVYAHTKRDIFDLLSAINEMARTAGTGPDTQIAIVSPDYWPLPWYLRDYKQVGFYGRPIADPTQKLVIGSTAQSDLQIILGLDYQLAGTYTLRPGVDLMLYVRRDAAR
ncbi:MAG TPA: flippase activity-associated protein Agl23 [Pyrinomonadaceae bacterium]|nr:flippase activity-associated protein Agl23 [Pyrinomonadaceae bacterium]